VIFAGSSLPERSIAQVVDPVVRSVSTQAEGRVLGLWRRRAKNAAHLLEYACLAVAIGVALGPGRPGRGAAPLLLALALTAAFAVTDELHQRLQPGRTARLSDWALDMAGASAGLVVLAALRRRSGRGSGSDLNPAIYGPGPEAHV
jgi:VanZ family protein